ncbi:MAG: hypothetical protein MUC98_10555 [Desulfobacterota bacterium]|jgi:hypothetical protein|nr:hypothetical protein [Thermodesulfobacteriota bacterium]
MDEVITRIVEIERQCSADVELAELEYGKKIEAHRRILEEKKARECALILSQENARLTRALEVAKRQVEASSVALRRESENTVQNPALIEAIKEEIISILLKSHEKLCR